MNRVFVTFVGIISMMMTATAEVKTATTYVTVATVDMTGRVVTVPVKVTTSYIKSDNSYKAPTNRVDKATAVEAMYESLKYIYYSDMETMGLEAKKFEVYYLNSGYNDVPTELYQRKMLRAWLASRYIELSRYSARQCISGGNVIDFAEKAKENVMKNITEKDIEIISKYYFLK